MSQEKVTGFFITTGLILITGGLLLIPIVLGFFYSKSIKPINGWLCEKIQQQPTIPESSELIVDLQGWKAWLDTDNNKLISVKFDPGFKSNCYTFSGPSIFDKPGVVNKNFLIHHRKSVEKDDEIRAFENLLTSVH